MQPTKEYFSDLYPNDMYLPEVSISTYLELKVNKADQGIKTRPGMDVTYADSTNIRRTVAGETLTGIGLVRNIAGNYWYKILLEDGKEGYVYAGHLDVVGALEDNVSMSTPFPAKLTTGKSQGIRGSVSTERTIISSITGCIQDSKGNSVKKKDSNVNSNNYSFQGSVINSALTFKKMQKGDCEFIVTVVTKNYYSNGTELQSGKYDKTYTLTYSFKET